MKKDDEKIKLIKKGIAWPSDRKLKFGNPEGALNETGGKMLLDPKVVSDDLKK